jgi:hypothetical protein
MLAAWNAEASLGGGSAPVDEKDADAKENENAASNQGSGRVGARLWQCSGQDFYGYDCGLGSRGGRGHRVHDGVTEDDYRGGGNDCRDRTVSAALVGEFLRKRNALVDCLLGNDGALGWRGITRDGNGTGHTGPTAHKDCCHHRCTGRHGPELPPCIHTHTSTLYKRIEVRINMK